jgi:hypothetical protein
MTMTRNTCDSNSKGSCRYAPAIQAGTRSLLAAPRVSRHAHAARTPASLATIVGPIDCGTRTTSAKPQQDPNNHDNTVAAGPGLRDYVAIAPTYVTRNATSMDGSSDANTIASSTPIMPQALILRGQHDFISESIMIFTRASLPSYRYISGGKWEPEIIIFESV